MLKYNAKENKKKKKIGVNMELNNIEEKFLIPNAVLKEYFNVNNILEVRPYGNGHINNTFLVVFPTCTYIMQKINNNVFENPFAVMHNIDEVTNHIRKNNIYDGKDPRTTTLTIILTRYNQIMCIVDDEYWRCMRFIEEGETFDQITDTKIFKEVAHAVGAFQKQLAGFHTRVLVDTIAHFHDTPYRYNHFKDVVKIDRMDRATLCKDEIKYVNSNKNNLDLIVKALEEKRIPRRVSHNDTKVNNVLISKKTGKALCLIDFDTVMKGSLLFDYGDALRLGAAIATEDETDLSKIGISFELFKAFTNAYLEEVKDIITKEEVELLVYSYFLMTFEVGMRFLTDFIDGDTYFRLNNYDKKHRPYINLERAKNQLKLSKIIKDNEKELTKIVNECLIKNNYEYTI